MKLTVLGAGIDNMIKFQNINNKLCLMTEQPCPHCSQPEIIATPVVDGSAEWALYRMMQGDKVCQKGSYFKRYYDTGDVIWLNKHNIELSLTADVFLKNFADTMDWQIYTEPKPLLADAKVGWLCKRSNGRYTQFHSKHKLKNGSIAYYFTDASGSTDIDGNHYIHECGNNIVSCEPLATEGTVEWAWQMMLLGDKVILHNDQMPLGYWELKIERGISYAHNSAMGWMFELDEFILDFSYNATGWQIYAEPKKEPETHKDFHYYCCICGKKMNELDSHARIETSINGNINEWKEHVPGYSWSNYCPYCYTNIGIEKRVKELKLSKDNVSCDAPKPKSATQTPLSVSDATQFEVGDWVTDGVINGKITSLTDDFAWVKTEFYEYRMSLRNLTPISSSEMVIHIGCLSGRIEALTCNCCKDKVFVLLLETGGFIEIPFSALDTPTRKLVRELIEKQKGDAK